MGIQDPAKKLEELRQLPPRFASQSIQTEEVARQLFNVVYSSHSTQTDERVSKMRDSATQFDPGPGFEDWVWGRDRVAGEMDGFNGDFGAGFF